MNKTYYNDCLSYLQRSTYSKESLTLCTKQKVLHRQRSQTNMTVTDLTCIDSNMKFIERLVFEKNAL